MKSIVSHAVLGSTCCDGTVSEQITSCRKDSKSTDFCISSSRADLSRSAVDVARTNVSSPGVREIVHTVEELTTTSERGCFPQVGRSVDDLTTLDPRFRLMADRAKVSDRLFVTMKQKQLI